MKRTIPYGFLAGCALGFLALSNHNATANEATPSPSSMPSCCSGMNATTIANTDTNAVPDRLKTCPVSGDKLGGDMGEAYVFVYKGQQVKLCCKGCKKDFDKDPAKYIKLIRAADKK